MMISVIANAQLIHQGNPIKSVDNSRLLDHFNLNSFGMIVGAVEYMPIAHSSLQRVSVLKKDTTIHLSAGELSNILTSFEKATITNLQLTGSIDARDFKTMRDSMPVLSVVDINNVSISAYTGMQGTAGIQNTIYPANSIPQSAFEFCSHLTGTLTLPNSVTSIGVRAFYQCQSLTGLVLSNSLTSISDGAFDGDWSLQGNLTIPNSVTSIGDYAFFYCSFTSVTIPNSVASIGVGAFGKCKFLTGNLILPNSITSISDAAFSLCARLTGITIPNSVTTIGNNAFTMAGLTSITIPNSVISIGDWAFALCNLTGSLTIPNSVTSIGRDAFHSNDLTGALAIPNSVTSIGTRAFSLNRITEFIVQNNNPNFSVREGVLFNKSQTRLIEYIPSKHGIYIIPNSVTSIGDYAFDYCNGLTGITIPQSVTSVGSSAFADCLGLTSIYVNSITPIDLSDSTNVFDQVNKSTCTLYIPAGSKALYQSANQWKDFVNIVEIFSTGTNELTGNEHLILYPNPFTEGFYINAGEKLTTVSIYNPSGMQLFSIQVTGKSYIDIATLPQGLYIVKISTPDGPVEKKLVKK